MQKRHGTWSVLKRKCRAETLMVKNLGTKNRHNEFKQGPKSQRKSIAAFKTRSHVDVGCKSLILSTRKSVTMQHICPMGARGTSHVWKEHPVNTPVSLLDVRVESFNSFRHSKGCKNAVPTFFGGEPESRSTFTEGLSNWALGRWSH